MNTREMFKEVRGNIGEKSAAHWSDLEVLRKLSAAHRRVAGMLMLKQGDWLLRSTELSVINGTVTLPPSCAKVAYVEDIGTGAAVHLAGTVRERRFMRPALSGMPLAMQDAYFIENGLELTLSEATGNVRVWYQRRVIDLLGGIGDTGSGANTIIARTTDGPSGRPDYYVGEIIEVIGGAGVGTIAEVTAYNPATRALTLEGTFDATSEYGLVPQVPEEGHDLIVLMATLQLMAKPSSDIEQEVFRFYSNLYAEAKELFNNWCSTRKSGSTHVRMTEIY